MGSDKFIELETGINSWFKTLYYLLALLAVLAIITANTTGFIKLTALGALFLFSRFSNRQMHLQQSIRQLRIYSNGTVTLISRSRQEFPGILEGNSWTTRWASIVPVGRFDRWGTQRLLVCASRSNVSDYRQLLKRLRLGGTRDAVL
ncbi:MAG: hypothetical protein V3S21_09005 [Xanthomonadales bacterium]